MYLRIKKTYDNSAGTMEVSVSIFDIISGNHSLGNQRAGIEEKTQRNTEILANLLDILIRRGVLDSLDVIGILSNNDFEILRVSDSKEKMKVTP